MLEGRHAEEIRRAGLEIQRVVEAWLLNGKYEKIDVSDQQEIG
jgi:hypothetical protein